MNVYQKLDAIYAKLPALKCQGKCQESCGPILMTKPEWDRIIKRLGYEPKSKTLLEACPMLNQETGRCSVYHIRPMICRLWGLVDRMRCPWGCVPDRYLQDPEAYKLLDEMEQL